MAKKSLSGYDINAPLLLTGSTGTAGQVLLSAGSGATPTWGTFTGITASSYVAVGVLAADQALTVSGTDTPVSFVDYVDPQNWWNPSTKRFTPNIAGYYNITFQTLWTSLNSTNQTNTQIRKNGNSETIQQRSPDANNPYFMSASKVIYMNGSTDYLEFTAWSPVTTQSLSQGNAAGSGTNFSAQLITSGANIVSNALTIGTTGLTATSGSSPWTGSAAATIDIDTTKVPQLTTNTNIFAAASGATTLVVKQGATQSVTDLFQIQNTSGTVLAGTNPLGQIYSGSTTPVTSSSVTANTALTSAAYTSATVATFTYAQGSQVVLVGQRVTVVNVSGGTYNGTWLVTATGGTAGAYTFTVVGSGFTNVSGTGGTFTLSSTASFTALTSATSALSLVAAASQTGNILEVQNSAGSMIFRVGSSGGITAGGVTTTGGITVSGASNPLTVGGTAGTSGQVLTSAGAGTTPAWSNVGYTLISTNNFNGTAPSFSSIPQTFKKLVATITFTNVGTISGTLLFAAGTGSAAAVPYIRWATSSATGVANSGTSGMTVSGTVAPVASQLYVVEVPNYTGNAQTCWGSGGANFAIGSISSTGITYAAWAASSSWGTAAGTAVLYGVN